MGFEDAGFANVATPESEGLNAGHGEKGISAGPPGARIRAHKPGSGWSPRAQAHGQRRRSKHRGRQHRRRQPPAAGQSKNCAGRNRRSERPTVSRDRLDGPTDAREEDGGGTTRGYEAPPRPHAPPPRPRLAPAPPHFTTARRGPPRRASKHAEKGSSAAAGTARALPGGRVRGLEEGRGLEEAAARSGRPRGDGSEGSGARRAGGEVGGASEGGRRGGRGGRG
nr:uncharacterized protein LOC127329438 [Lolium perenne]